MKTKMKALTLVLCAILLVCASVMGTLAYLKATTGPVTNTFTVGKVNITLDEAQVDVYGAELTPEVRVTANTYKLIPGHNYAKDPTIHVTKGSEACFVFVKVENGLKDIIDGVDAVAIEKQITDNGWKALPGVANVYYKNVDSLVEATEDLDLVVFEEFTLTDGADVEAYKDEQIVITGYAIQADGFNGDAVAAWEAGEFK